MSVCGEGGGRKRGRERERKGKKRREGRERERARKRDRGGRQIERQRDRKKGVSFLRVNISHKLFYFGKTVTH